MLFDKDLSLNCGMLCMFVPGAGHEHLNISRQSTGIRMETSCVCCEEFAQTSCLAGNAISYS